MKNIQCGRDSIRNEWERLNHQWNITASLWNDTNRIDFERDFMSEYAPTIRSLLNSIDLLSDLINQAKREVK